MKNLLLLFDKKELNGLFLDSDCDLSLFEAFEILPLLGYGKLDSPVKTYKESISYEVAMNDNNPDIIAWSVVGCVKMGNNHTIGDFEEWSDAKLFLSLIYDL